MSKWKSISKSVSDRGISGHRLALVAGLFAAGAALAAATASPVTRGFAAVRHSHVSVLRNEDGSVRLGSRNEVQTENWSGYVLSNFVTGNTYDTATASWTVPQVTYKAPTAQSCHSMSSGSSNHRSSRQVCFQSNAGYEYSATWVGIGGTCENTSCSKSDETLIQLGTEQDAAEDGSTQYYAWYEMLPNYPVVISAKANCNDTSCAYPVKPGDAITATLTCKSNCETGQTQSWLLTLADATQKWTYSKTVNYRSTLASAEWVQEAPTGNAGVLPLSDFATFTLDPTDNNAIPGFMNAANGTVGPDAYAMVDPYGETSQPSPVVSLDAFAACWGDNPTTIAACPAP